MTLAPLRTAAERLLTFPARRPVVTLVAGAVVLVLAAIGVSRIRANTSLQTLFPRGKPSADALVRVLDAFPASGELILLASVPDDQPLAADRLRAFAERFEQQVRASPDARALTGGISYQVDPDHRQFAERVLVPAGLYYLDDATFAEARKRLSADGIREQVRRNEAMVSQPGPAAGAAAKQLLKDPLRLHEFVLDRLAGPRQLRTYENGPTFISPDGRAILIRIAGTESSADLEYCERLMRAMTAAAGRANTDKLTLDFTGAYAAADYSHHTIRFDSIVSIATSITLLQVLFLIFYRRPVRQFLLEITPVVVGVFVGFGVYGWARGGLSPIAAVIGGILAGLGVDYSVLYLAGYFRHLRDGRSPIEAVRLTATQTVAPMFAAWFTSAVGFVAIAWSSVGTLRDFALLGSLGLMGAFASVTLLLPAVVTLWDTRRLARRDTPADRALPFRFNIEGLLGVIDRRRTLLIAASLGVLAIATVLAVTRPGGMLPLEENLHVMHPQPNPALAAQRKLVDRFGVDPVGGLMVHLTADSPQQLLALAHEVDRRLARPQVRAAGVAGSLGLASLLPDPAVAERLRAAISPGEAEQVAKDFRAAIEDSLFDPAAYEPYANFLRFALTQQNVPTVASLVDYPAVARNFLPRATVEGTAPATEAITLVFLGGTTDERSKREAVVNAARDALAGLTGVTLTGLPVISMDTETAIRQDLPRLMSISAVLVAAYLLVHYRSAGRALLALTPVLFSLVVLAGAARVLDLRLNLVNLVALPLLIGIDVDYGIYLVSLAEQRRQQKRRQAEEAATAAGGGTAAGEAVPTEAIPPLLNRIAASAQAVVVCATASGLGFGSLATVSVPAVQSLGIAVAVGVAACVVGAFGLLAPVLMVLDRREGGRAGAREADVV